MRIEPACISNDARRFGPRTALPAVALLVLGLASGAADAQAQPRLYQVEVVIFSQPAGSSVERLPLPRATGPELRPENAPDPDALTALGGMAPILPVGVSGPVAPRQLDAVARRLNTGGYRLLWHQAWVQPARGREGLDLATLAALGQGPAAAELSGAITLSAGRFLHLGLSVELASELGLEATLQQQRRVRLGDQHYFDHPHIGIIAVINRHVMDDDQSEP
jgi:hypothetical protein